MEIPVRRASDHRSMRWKNGGGTTLEALRLPEGSSMDDFDLRISFAHVDRGGPFSSFPGIDRVIALVRGGRMVLDVAGDGRHDLGPFEPYAFPGETPVTSAITESSLDFNVMTRRASLQYEVLVRRVQGEQLTVPSGAWIAVLDGTTTVAEATLGSLDLAGPLPAPARLGGTGVVAIVIPTPR